MKPILLILLVLLTLPCFADGTNAAPLKNGTMSSSYFLKMPDYVSPKFTVTLYASDGKVARVWAHCEDVKLITTVASPGMAVLQFTLNKKTVFCGRGPFSIEPEL